MGVLSSFFESFKKKKAPRESTVTNQVVTSIAGWAANRPKSADLDLRNLIHEGYRRNVVIYCCVNEIAGSVAEPALHARKIGSDKPLPDEHPLPKLLQNPHPDHSKFTLFESVLIQLQTTGSAYIHKGRNVFGEVIRLTPLRSDRIAPVPGADGSIASYEYTVDSIIQSIPADDVIRIVLPDPLNDYHGLSPIEVCHKFGDIDSEAAQYLRDFFTNGGVPAGILKLKVEARPEERERIRDHWRETYGRGGSAGSRTGWHKIAVFNADVEYQDVGTSPGKLDMDSIWGITESRICATFKVPAVIVQVRIGMQMSTYSNYETAQKSFWSETLAPMYARLDEALTSQLASEFGEDLEVYFDIEHVAALAEGEDAKIDRALRLYAGGLKTLNQSRELVGAEPLPQDYLVVPQGAIKVDEKGKPTEEPQPMLPGQPGVPGLPGAVARPALPAGAVKKPAALPATKPKGLLPAKAGVPPAAGARAREKRRAALELETLNRVRTSGER